MANLFNYLKHSWTAFRSQDAPDINPGPVYGPPASSINPSRQQISYGNERSIINSLYNKIAVDVSLVVFFEQCKEEKDEMVYNIPVDNALTDMLKIEANIDQTGPELIKSLVFKMLDEGCAALVPTKTTGSDPRYSDSYTVCESRVGTIKQWRENDVVIDTFNPHAQRYMSILLPKRIVPIIENPFYAIMNEPNSLYQRLVRTLKSIDRLNDQNSSNKLDLIIQLPYASRSNAKRTQAEERRNEIEEQLNGQLGIAYIDANEKVIQLNRSIENNLWAQAQDLLNDLFGQLGMSPSIFNGTANEQEIFNYYSKTLKPICSTIALNISRKWLSKTSRSQGHSIAFYQDPFEMLPTTQLATMIDTFIKDQVLSPNEGRILIGRQPSKAASANMLANPFTSSGKEQSTESSDQSEQEDV